MVDVLSTLSLLLRRIKTLLIKKSEGGALLDWLRCDSKVTANTERLKTRKRDRSTLKPRMFLQDVIIGIVNICVLALHEGVYQVVAEVRLNPVGVHEVVCPVPLMWCLGMWPTNADLTFPEGDHERCNLAVAGVSR
jgi:hypothetical protein